MNKRALAAGFVGSAVTAAIILAVTATGKSEAGGFLGPGPLLADINLVLELLLVAGLTWGMRLARAGAIEAHRTNQTVWVLVNATLVAFIMIPAIATFKLPSVKALADVGNLITIVHALVGTFTVVAGLWLVLQMNDVLPPRLHVRGWKTLMRLTLAGYWAVALLGIATYYYWFAA